MAGLTSLDFATLVQNMVTAAQARSTKPLKLSVGSVLRAMLEAVGSVVLWLQGQVAYVLTITRAATSVGPDLDSFYADFDFPRLKAVYSTGSLTFSRLSSTGKAVVPVNVSEQTQDGTQTFFVTLDTTNSHYSASDQGYVMADGIPSVTVPAQAVTAGSDGNVLENTITVITSNITGVDSVTNSAAFVNGLDAEEDPDYSTRFVLYINSLSKGIYGAIALAILSVRQGLKYTLTENQNYSDASSNPGYFYAVIDDGTGFPSDALVAQVSSAIEAVRGLTITYGVFKPEVLTATINATVTSAVGYIHGTVASNVSLAITSFVNGLPLGTTLPYTQLAAIAYSVPGVQNVTGITINSGTTDLTADQKHKINAGTVTVS